MNNPIQRAFGYKADRDWITWVKDIPNPSAWVEWFAAVKYVFCSCFCHKEPTNSLDTRNIEPIAINNSKPQEERLIPTFSSTYSLTPSTEEEASISPSIDSEEPLHQDDPHHRVKLTTYPLVIDPESSRSWASGASSPILSAEEKASISRSIGLEEYFLNSNKETKESTTKPPVYPKKHPVSAPSIDKKLMGKSILKNTGTAPVDRAPHTKKVTFKFFDEDGCAPKPNPSTQHSSDAKALTSSKRVIPYIERDELTDEFELVDDPEEIEEKNPKLLKEAIFTASIFEQIKSVAFKDLSSRTHFTQAIKELREAISSIPAALLNISTIETCKRIYTGPWPEAALKSLRSQLSPASLPFSGQINIDITSIKNPKNPNDYESTAHRSYHKLCGITNYFDTLLQGNLPFIACFRTINGRAIAVIRQGIPTVEGLPSSPEKESTSPVKDTAIAVGNATLSGLAAGVQMIALGATIVKTGMETKEGSQKTLSKLGKAATQLAISQVQGNVEIAPEYLGFVEKCKRENKKILYCCLLNPLETDELPRIKKLQELQSEYVDTFHFMRFPLDGPLAEKAKNNNIGLTQYAIQVRYQLEAGLNDRSTDFIFSSSIKDILRESLGSSVEELKPAKTKEPTDFYIKAAEWALKQINQAQRNLLDKDVIYRPFSPKEQKKAFMMLYCTILKDRILSRLEIDFYNNTCKDGIDRGAAHLITDILWHAHLTHSHETHKEMIRELTHLPAYMAKTQAILEERASWIQAFANFLDSRGHNPHTQVSEESLESSYESQFGIRCSLLTQSEPDRKRSPAELDSEEKL